MRLCVYRPIQEVLSAVTRLVRVTMLQGPGKAAPGTSLGDLMCNLKVTEAQRVTSEAKPHYQSPISRVIESQSHENSGSPTKKV